MKEPNLKLVRELLIDASPEFNPVLNDDTVLGDCPGYHRPSADGGCCLGLDSLQLAVFVGNLNDEMTEVAPGGVPWALSSAGEKNIETNLNTMTFDDLCNLLTREGL